MKNPSQHPTLVFLVVLLCVLAPFCAHGAIVNGGFEDTTFNPATPFEPTIDFWEVSTGGNTNIHAEDTGSNSVPWHLAPKGGALAASFASNNDATGPGGSLTQAPTDPSFPLGVTDLLKTYDLTMQIANPIQDAANFNNVFSVTWAGTLITLAGSGLTQIGTTKTYIVTPQTAWFLVTATVSGTGVATTDLVISARNNNWATLVDQVTFEPTPEPSTLVMLGAGAAMLGLRRRRQQRAS